MLLRASQMSKNRWQMLLMGVNQKKSLFGLLGRDSLRLHQSVESSAESDWV